MAFSKQPAPVPSASGPISTSLADNGDNTHRYTYSIVVFDQNGAQMGVVTGDLEPQLSAAQATTLGNFMAALRLRAQTEILP